MQQVVVSPLPTPNRHTLDQLLAKITELGEQAGKGKDTQIKFLLSCVEGGYHGAVDLVSNKHGTEIDDAMTNICRCGPYQRIREAVHMAAGGETTGRKS